MKRLLLTIIVVGILFLVACTPTAAPKLTTTPTTIFPTYILGVSVSPSGAGSVSPPGGKYVSGIAVTLTATPSTGYTFDYWDGAVSSSLNRITVIIDSNKNVTAHFKVVNTP